jgi:hypothetical protein
MKHFESVDWSCFARGVVDAGQRQMMQEHLDSGCTMCGKRLAMLKATPAIAGGKDTKKPSQAEFSGPDHASGIAEMIFDSFREPMPAGVRSTSSTARHLLYRMGLFEIEMRFEFAPDSQRYTLTGQIFNTEEGSALLKDVPISMRRGRNEVVQALTNEFGEFSLEYDTGENVEICFVPSREKDIFVPLNEAFWRVFCSGLQLG